MWRPEFLLTYFTNNSILYLYNEYSIIQVTLLTMLAYIINQHTYWQGRIEFLEFLEFQNDIVANMNNGKQTDVIVMDFAKAFDKVGHRRLIEKMKYYGVGGKTNKWIEDFLAGRSQRVVFRW